MADRDPLTRLANLADRGKAPVSAGVLDNWVNAAQAAVGLQAGLLSWLVAATVVVATLQRAVDADGQVRFLLKGGTYLQHRMGWTGRPTKDVDGLIAGDIDDFLLVLDDTLRQPWGPLTLSRTDIETIDTPGKVTKPRRFDVRLSLRGKVWRRIQVEISPDEAGAGTSRDELPTPDLKHFGLPTPDKLFGIALRYQGHSQRSMSTFMRTLSYQKHVTVGTDAYRSVGCGAIAANFPWPPAAVIQICPPAVNRTPGRRRYLWCAVEK